jgi:amino acid adenylation domain-containing protein
MGIDSKAQTPDKRRQLLARLMRDQADGQPRQQIPKQVPMSFAQQRLWFLDQLTGGSALYNMACPQRFPFALDVEVLRRCLLEIMRRHESLRTRFGMSGGTPVQIIASHLDLELPVEDLRNHPADRRDYEALRLTTEESQTSFDLRTGPLLRTKLLRLADGDYIFLLTIHHIVSDGWSMGVFFGELGVLYQSFMAGQPSPLPELTVQYSDFAVWQRNWLQGDVRESQLSYWKKQLAGMAPLELPADRVRPALPSFRGAAHPIYLGAELVEQLRALGHKQDATLFIVLLAAFQLLMHRYTGQDSIVIGSPVANRNRAETEGLIGFFVNSLVMHTRLEGDPSFPGLLERVRETALGAYANQDLPFEMLVEELHPERDLSRNPLFQVIFQLMDTSTTGDTSGGAYAPQAPALQMATSKFDLNLTLFATSAGVTGVLEYTSDLFDAGRIARMAGHYCKLLDEIVRDPSRPISKIPLLTAAERRQILTEWNTTTALFPRRHGVRESFEWHAAKQPEARAVCFGEREVTYGELEAGANRLAAHLREQEVTDGATVAICLPRSPEFILTALAAWKAGAAYLPMDPEQPGSRLSLMLAESEAAVLVTNSSDLQRFEGFTRPIICLDRDAAIIEKLSPDNQVGAYKEDALAYVIFTSGSTGKPKGVEIEHRGLMNLVSWTINAFHVEPAHRATQFASPGFDASVWEVWPYLAAGASVVIVDDAVRYAPARLPEWLVDNGITHCFIPTPIVDYTVRQTWPQGCALRYLLTGGDRLRRGIPAGLSFEVFNMYGPTENSVVTTWARVPEDSSDVAPPSIGRPISNVELFVIDRTGEPVPVGVPGELWIGGEGLARGYRNAPEFTQERFVPHPLKPGKRVYRSGDLVRYRADGNLEFIGRVDEQIKIRGFRIEPGEIEALLARDPNVQAACVVACEPVTGEMHLVAYLTGKPGAVVDVAALRENSRNNMPAYMVPSHFVIVDELPLNANGKIEKNKLPPIVALQQEREQTPPRTKIEECIAAIWRDELHLEQVGIDENFFDIGGNSLALVAIHARLEEKMPDRVSVVDLFRYPTIRSLAVFLDEQTGQRNAVEKARERAALRKKRSVRRGAGGPA